MPASQTPSGFAWYKYLAASTAFIGAAFACGSLVGSARPPLIPSYAQIAAVWGLMFVILVVGLIHPKRSRQVSLMVIAAVVALGYVVKIIVLMLANQQLRNIP